MSRYFPAFLTLAAFFLAIVFHGAKFAPDVWFNWQGLALIGLFFLSWCVVRDWDWALPPGRRRGE